MAAKILRNEIEKKERWLSIRILYVTMFFDSLAFSIVLSSMWPYLMKVDQTKTVTPAYVGWANIAFQLAGILIDFVMGFWVNARGSKEPLVVSMGLFGVGSFLYGYAQSLGAYGVVFVIVSRAIIGFSTGIDVIARSVIAQATTIKERTGAMSRMSIAQGAGFSCGPALQLALIPLGDGGIYFRQLKLHLNLYTAPAFVSIFIAIMNLILIAGWYREYCINIYDDVDFKREVFPNTVLINETQEDAPRWNILAVVVVLFLYFTGQNAFSFQESILSPLAMYEFAWTKEDTSLWVGVMFLVAGVIAILMFAATECLERRFNDQTLLIFGFFMLLFGFAFFLPWGNELPIVKQKGSTSVVLANKTLAGISYSTEVGCPIELSWCKRTPRLYLPQIIVGMVFLSIGYPFVMVIATTLYSKILGPNPQGIMQSWLAAVGGIARTTGPALVTNLFVSTGPRWTFVCIEYFLVLALLISIASLKILVPYHKYVAKRRNSSFANSSERDNECTSSLYSSSILEEDYLISSV